MSALCEHGADKEQNIHSDRFQETAPVGGGGRQGAGLQVGFQEGAPAGSPHPWKRANHVTRCRPGRGADKGRGDGAAWAVA